MWRRVLLIVGLTMLVTSCSSFVHGVAAPTIPVPVVQKIPLTVGVHYTPQFRDAQPASRRFVAGSEIKDVYQLGAPSVAVFDAALRHVFETVIEVKSWPPGDEPLKVAGVLIPSIPPNGVTVYLGQPRIAVEYRVGLFSSSGGEIGSWRVVGIAGGPAAEMPALATLPVVVSEALRSAAAGVVASFFREPQARAWLEANGVRPDELR
jgi:hypothetical protein